MFLLKNETQLNPNFKLNLKNDSKYNNLDLEAYDDLSDDKSIEEEKINENKPNK